jgi:hypothetical protein
LLTSFLALAACGSSSSSPTAPAADPWVGTWTLVSVNGVPVPADVTVLGYSTRVVSRTLTLTATVAIWKDSSLSALLCPGSNKVTMCNASGAALMTWTATDSKLVAAVNPSTVSGYVVALKTFQKQSDGTLLKTDDSQTEIYRRP